MKRVWALTLLPLAVAGCAIKAPSSGTQAARFGVLVSWDTSQPGATTTAEDALVVQCGFPAPSGPATTDSSGSSSSYVTVPSGTLTDTETSCLTAAKIVKMVDILNGPAPAQPTT